MAQRPVTLCRSEECSGVRRLERSDRIGLVISDKDIGDGGDTEAGLGEAGQRESLHQLQDSEQVTITKTLSHLQTDGDRGQRRQGHGCRDEASQV